jgi:hypothetical protein
MKRIGRGWQYDVYDSGNGRVLKKPYSRVSRFLRIFRQSGEFSLRMARDEMTRVDRDGRAAEEFVSSHRVDRALLGNPKFNPDGSYEQDKTIVFEKAWESASTERRKEMLRAYTELIHATWRDGFADRIFNFSVNNGFDVLGRLIQIDFGEMALSREKVEHNIRNKRWQKSYSYLSLTPPDMKSYYEQLMDAEITLENLERYWGKA